MQKNHPLFCPNCNNNQLLLKYEVTYEYSYVLDANAPGECNSSEFLPYLYDSREQKSSHQYIQCTSCGSTFPCYFEEWRQDSDIYLQKAMGSSLENQSDEMV